MCLSVLLHIDSTVLLQFSLDSVLVSPSGQEHRFYRHFGLAIWPFPRNQRAEPSAQGNCPCPTKCCPGSGPRVRCPFVQCWLSDSFSLCQSHQVTSQTARYLPSAHNRCTYRPRLREMEFRKSHILGKSDGFSLSHGGLCILPYCFPLDPLHTWNMSLWQKWLDFLF